jgi:hypothetical protein
MPEVACLTMPHSRMSSRLLEPREYKGMETYEVSRRVNTAKTDTSDLINRKSEGSGLSSLREVV